MQAINREYCLQLDKQDQLASFRNEFSLPEHDIYMSGNSLGAMPKKAMSKVEEVVLDQWGTSLIKSWNIHGWFTLSQTIGDKLATTIGADAGEVVVTDATGINVFKVIAAALTLNPDRKKIVMEGSNFPTDNYTAQGLVKLLGNKHELVFAETEQGILDAIDDSVAVVCLTQVHYKTGRLLNMKAITEKTQQCGAISVWDLCHSGGALPIDLNACNVDFAIGCTYKYYNGGPGSPAFVFCAKRHQGKALQPLTGWYSHAAPFAFEQDYRPANNINQMLSGTQAILSLALSEIGIDISARVDAQALREKSLNMSDLFIQLVAQECGEFGFKLITPKERERRGSQVAMSHEDGYAIVQALIGSGVMGDFRAPDTLRFGLTPLYLRFVDVWDAVARLKVIMQEQTYKQAEFNQKHAVT
ncbi:kynureninase [Thalassotalea sp. ND16A]|uniref:kynureninase n=1 Tax=Thalassotalea sp. ND16A TaxID=1535422 RepID=UPI000519FA46|nr:kynureninase [Thalassotalea sp. ND16A]KGJ99157.1 Kynureninase [Thalassotalea sp. ND16A]